MIETENYEMLKKLGVLDIKEYKKIKSEGYMDLNVDILFDNDKERVIAMAHNFIQEGDLMADPDMEIHIYKGLQEAEAITYQLDSLGIFQRVYDDDGHVNSKLRQQLNTFLHTWLKNLHAQGFY